MAAGYENNGLPGKGLDEIYEAFARGLAARGYKFNDIMNASPSADQAGAADYLQCIMMPEDRWETPVRFHDPTNSAATAALCQVDFMQVTWQFQPNLNNGVNTQMSPGEMGCFTFDDNPMHIMSVYNPNPNYAPWKYNLTFNGNTKMYWKESGALECNKAMVDLTAEANWDPHGIYLYGQYDDQGNYYSWIDCKPGVVDSTGAAAPTKITVQLPGVTAVPATRLLSIALYRYYAGNPKLCQQQDLTAGQVTGGFLTLTFTLNGNTNDPSTGVWATYSDYYCLRVANPDTSAANINATSAAILGGVTVSWLGVMSVLQHIAVKECESLVNLFSDKGRINAMSARFTEIPMLQYQNGLIAGATFWSGDNWYEAWGLGLNYNNSFFNFVSKMDGALVHENWKGGYIYHKPIDVSFTIWQKWTEWDIRTKAPSNLGVKIDTVRPVKVMAVIATNDFTPGNPNGGGCVGAITYACMMEWICPVSYYPKRLSPYTREACAIALDAIGHFPDFVENDAHWDKMMGYIGHTISQGIPALANHGAPFFRALIDKGSRKVGEWSPVLGRILGAAGNAALTAAQRSGGGGGGKKRRQ